MKIGAPGVGVHVGGHPYGSGKWWLGVGWPYYYHPWWRPGYYSTWWTPYYVPVVAAPEVDPCVQAQVVFQQGNYPEALNWISRALQANPQNIRCQQLGVFALMAMGQYQTAAGAAHSVASMNAIPDWPTVAGFYGNNAAVFTSHLRALEAFAGQNTMAAEARFLLGFNYLVIGNPVASGTQFAEAARLVPQDPMASQLASQFGGTPPAANPPVATTTPPATEPTAEPTGPEPEASGPDTGTARGDTGSLKR